MRTIELHILSFLVWNAWSNRLKKLINQSYRPLNAEKANIWNEISVFILHAKFNIQHSKGEMKVYCKEETTGIYCDFRINKLISYSSLSVEKKTIFKTSCLFFCKTSWWKRLKEINIIWWHTAAGIHSRICNFVPGCTLTKSIDYIEKNNW